MKPKHWFVFLLLGAIWSSSFMWIKLAVQEIGPMTLVAYRVLFGLLFGIAVILIQRVSLRRSFQEWRPLLLLGITIGMGLVALARPTAREALGRPISTAIS